MSINNRVQSIREEFPILKFKTYLNSAAHGPVLKRVWESVQEWWNFRLCEDLSVRQPYAKVEAAKLIHASTEEICWCSRVTQGFNMVSSMMDLKKGENVVVTDLGYPSNVYVWLPFREKGVKIRRINNRDGLIDNSDFEAAIDDKTRVVSISHIEWTSGIRYDMESIVEIAHEHGALVIDDGYQAVGPIDVNVRRDGVDFLLVGSEKWLCSPAFAGIFYIRKDILDEFEPKYRFYNQVEEAFINDPPWMKPDSDNITSYDKPLYPNAEKFYRGCVAESAIWGFNASLEYFNELGASTREKIVLDNSEYLIDKLLELGLKVNTPIEPENRGGLVTYTTGRHKIDVESYQTLLDKGIIVALRSQGGVGGIRVSTHIFNTKKDIDQLIEIQKGVIT